MRDCKLFILPLKDNRHVVASVDGSIIGLGSTQNDAINSALNNGARLCDIDVPIEEGF